MSWRPYTYLLKCPNGLYYYGVRYGKSKNHFADPDLFWVNYFTSCEKVHSLIHQYGKDSFSFEIRKIFSSSEEAIKWESKVNRRLTTKSKKFLNDSFMDGRDQSGKNNGNYGKHMPQEAKIKMVLSRRVRFDGKYSPPERDLSYITSEYRDKLRDAAKLQHLEGRMYSIIDIGHLVEQYENYDFPTDDAAYKTKGSKASKITYFVKNFYLPKFGNTLNKSKNPEAALVSRLKKYDKKYGLQNKNP